MQSCCVAEHCTVNPPLQADCNDASTVDFYNALPILRDPRSILLLVPDPLGHVVCIPYLYLVPVSSLFRDMVSAATRAEFKSAHNGFQKVV